MIRATGGSACAATTTRSRSWARAIPRASSFVLIPSCEPSSPMSRTRAARMFSFSSSFRGGRGGSGVNLPRRGLKNVSPSCQLLLLERQNRCVQRPVSSSVDSVQPSRAASSEGEERVRSCFSGSERSKGLEELVQGLRRLCAVALADREGVVRLPVAVHDHVRDLRELGLAN